MKIVVSASGPELDAAVNPRFGRAPYFLLITPAPYPLIPPAKRIIDNE